VARLARLGLSAIREKARPFGFGWGALVRALVRGHPGPRHGRDACGASTHRVAAASRQQGARAVTSAPARTQDGWS
jgi:hypothetical protein